MVFNGFCCNVGQRRHFISVSHHICLPPLRDEQTRNRGEAVLFHFAFSSTVPYYSIFAYLVLSHLDLSYLNFPSRFSKSSLLNKRKKGQNELSLHAVLEETRKKHNRTPMNIYMPYIYIYICIYI